MSDNRTDNRIRSLYIDHLDPTLDIKRGQLMANLTDRGCRYLGKTGTSELLHAIGRLMIRQELKHKRCPKRDGDGDGRPGVNL